MRGKRKFLLLLLLVVLVGAVAGLIVYQTCLKQAGDTNQRLQEIAQSGPETATIATEETVDSGEQEEAERPETTEEPFVSPINFAALQEENSQIYGWLRIEDTVIDYPILQSDVSDPDYYVNHTVEKTEGYPGAIFTESDLNEDPFEDPVTVVYGHDMKDGSMFGTLDYWTEESYRHAHSGITVYTEKHTYTYTVAFVQLYDTRNILARYDCRKKKEYRSFLHSLDNVHLIPCWHSEEISLDTEQQMIILSTCSGGNRLLVGAVLSEKE